MTNFIMTLELARNTTRININSPIIDILLRRQLLPHLLILNLAIMKARGFSKTGRGGGRGRTVFVGVIKYFRHTSMGHEILFKIFDEPRNIFVCSIFIMLFFNLKRLQHKISKLAIKEI